MVQVFEMEQKIRDRKQYVDSIRKSFQEQTQEEIEEYGDFSESPVSFYFKIQIFLAICVFLGFAVCDQMGGKIYSYSTKDIVSAMENNYFQSEYDTVVSEVMNLFSQENDKE